MPENSSERPQAGLVAIIASLAALVAFIVVRCRDLTTYGLWMDEVYSVRFARASWPGLIEQTAADAVHPPLFYILLKIWITIGGESLLWLKLLPLLFSIASIFAIYLVARELSVSNGEFAIALIFISPNALLIYYAQELRMYGLLILLSLLSVWAFIRFVNKRGRHPGIVFFVINALFVYTHYFAWLTVAAEGFALVILYRPNLKQFVRHGVGLIIAFLPWVLAVASAAAARGTMSGNLAWIDRPTLMAIPVFLADLQGHFGGLRSTIGIGMVIFMTPLAIWLWQKRRDTETRQLAILLGSLTAVPIVTAFAVSQLFSRSIWVDRYLIATGIPFLMLLALAATRIRPRALSITFLILILGWSLGAGAWNLLYRRERVNWTALAAELTASRDAPVYTNEEWVELPLAEAMSRAGRPRMVQLVRGPSGIDTPEFWFGYRTTTWSGGRSPEDMFAERGCSVTNSAIDRTAMESVSLLHVQCPAA